MIIRHSYRLNLTPGLDDIIRSITGFTYSAALAVKVFFFISDMLVTDSLLKKQSIPVFWVSSFFRIVPELLLLLLISAFLVGSIATRHNILLYIKQLLL